MIQVEIIEYTSVRFSQTYVQQQPLRLKKNVCYEGEGVVGKTSLLTFVGCDSGQSLLTGGHCSEVVHNKREGVKRSNFRRSKLAFSGDGRYFQEIKRLKRLKNLNYSNLA